MACQGPDGLKVICRLPDLVNVFKLLAKNIYEIESSPVFDNEDPEYRENFHVLYTLANRIGAKLNALSIKLNKYRSYLIELIGRESSNKTRPLLLQKVTSVLKDLRQEMSRFVPAAQNDKKKGRQRANQEALQKIEMAQKMREAQLESDAASRAEDALYRNAADLRLPSKELDDLTVSGIEDIRILFKHLHVLGRAETSLMRLEQDISDFLTEILLLFQEEIVELKMLIRMCQSSTTAGSDKDKDKRVLNALKAVKQHLAPDSALDQFETQQIQCDGDSRSWYSITMEFMSESRLID